MKSVRLDAELERKLKEAAQVEGVSESALIRQAIEQRCDAILSDRADVRLADVIGSVHGGGGRARAASKVFADLLLARAQVERAEREAARR